MSNAAKIILGVLVVLAIVETWAYGGPLQTLALGLVVLAGWGIRAVVRRARANDEQHAANPRVQAGDPRGDG